MLIIRRAAFILGLALILVAGFASNVEFFQRTHALIEEGVPYIDGITLWEKRLEPLLDDLSKTGVIGYLTDWDMPGQGDSSDLEMEFRLTQYALAPRVVAPGAGHDYVVGNITVTEFDEELQEHFRLHIQHKFDYGFLLLRKY